MSTIFAIKPPVSIRERRPRLRQGRMNDSRGLTKSKGKKLLDACGADCLDEMDIYDAFVVMWSRYGGKTNRVKKAIKTSRFLQAERRIDISFAPTDFGEDPPVLFSPGLVSFSDNINRDIISISKERLANKELWTKQESLLDQNELRIKHRLEKSLSVDFGEAVMYGWINDELGRSHPYATGPLPICQRISKLIETEDDFTQNTYALSIFSGLSSYVL